MVPKQCKRLAEVDFPIAEVGSAVLDREKKFPVPRGLPSTLHHWWARRPLASSRAILLALLIPDPDDRHCPASFKEQAREILLAMYGRPSSWDRLVDTDDGLRRMLLAFIADFAHWDNAASSPHVEAGRALVRAAYPEETPLVVDPFAGGGAIPLEALRLGCDTFASDLNPVACLILKVMLEDIPRRGARLADDLQQAGMAVKNAVGRELATLYPVDPDGAMPIAYLWARTVRCEAPVCGAEIPLLRSLWVCRKPKRKRALRVSIQRREGETPEVQFELFEPESNDEVAKGTVARARATCPCCGSMLPPERVRSQLTAQNGGADVVFGADGARSGGARITAVVTLQPGKRGRHYRVPNHADYEAVRRAQELVNGVLNEWEGAGRQSLCPVPDEPLPPRGTLGFRVQLYGMLRWGDLFTARQKAAFIHCYRRIASLYGTSRSHEYTAELLAIALDKVADFNCSLAQWRPSNEDVGHLFGRQAVPIVWDFAETNPVGEGYVTLERAISHVLTVVQHTASAVKKWGSVQQEDAATHPLPDESCDVWFTDPPYYDAVPYADLSDFFLVWLKRSLPGHPLLRDPFNKNNSLSPKDREAVQDETKRVDGSAKDRMWFEEAMAKSFAEGRRVLNQEGVGSVVFAHKTTEGWEALLSGMIRGGWTITGSWPIATEMRSRLRARDSAALATSIHLICRPRPEEAPVGDWAKVLRELPTRVGKLVQRLQGEGIRGADLVFACIGPALEVYSRYSAVETPEGREVGLPEYLERVWEVVGREALEQVLGTAEAQARNGQAGLLEEDARLTALFLWTMQTTEEGADAGSSGGSVDATDTRRGNATTYSLPFDVVRRFAQPLGIHLDDWESRIIKTTKGVVRLTPVRERGKQLFGEGGAGQLADEIESFAEGAGQLRLLFDVPAEAPSVRGRPRSGRRSAAGLGDVDTSLSATTLDRVHAAMLLQASGRSRALRALLRAEQDRGPDFLRLANAFSALYPRGSDEKRLLDAMLLAAR